MWDFLPGEGRTFRGNCTLFELPIGSLFFFPGEALLLSAALFPPILNTKNFIGFFFISSKTVSDPLCVRKSGCLHVNVEFLFFDVA